MYILTLVGSGYNHLDFEFKGENAVEQMTAFIEIIEAHATDSDLEIAIKKGEA